MLLPAHAVLCCAPCQVNGHTIKLTLNKDIKWTKALKFMLANLKVALQWMVKAEYVTVPTLQNLRPEGPALAAQQ